MEEREAGDPPPHLSLLSNTFTSHSPYLASQLYSIPATLMLIPMSITFFGSLKADKTPTPQA